ncbi:MAG: hypothetical protein E7158_03565 [Firmicutes bacterium]|nr:hypothetical protein [Bacillota bacterium]
MKTEIWMKLENDPKMSNYLKINSEWYKYLNRNPINYQKFVNAMKEKYKIRTSDKINSVIDNIDTVSSILNILK